MEVFLHAAYKKDDHWEYTSSKGDPKQKGNLPNDHFGAVSLNNYHILDPHLVGEGGERGWS